MSSIIRTTDDCRFRNVFGEASRDTERVFPFSSSEYYLSLIRSCEYSDPIFRQCIPSAEELHDTHGTADPFCENAKQHVFRLIHRYPRRAVLITTNVCAVHCRHCMRKRQWKEEPFFITRSEIDTAMQYCEDHGINDIILSGGDPLMLPKDILEYCITACKDSKSIQVMRIGTRVPVVDPERVTDEIAALCEIFPTTYVLTHFNHPIECTPDALHAIKRLRAHGAVLLNQNVLLKGINDNADILYELYTQLLSWGVKPYYMHQCDLTEGTTHFWVEPEKGVALLKALQGNISGLALPYYAIDLPGGKGKILLGPETSFEKDGDTYYFITYTGEKVAYRL